MLLAAASMFLDLGLVKKFNIEKEVSSVILSLIWTINLCPSSDIKMTKLAVVWHVGEGGLLMDE
jgi:metal-sulfur cluster biosynthetic enzyme